MSTGQLECIVPAWLKRSTQGWSQEKQNDLKIVQWKDYDNWNLDQITI